MITTDIREAMKVAMKAREQLRLDTLRMVLSGFTNELVSKGRKPSDELTDAEALAVLKRLVKQRKDSAGQYTAAGRTELAEKELAEIEVLAGYMPASVSKVDIERVAKAKMQEMGITDKAGMGKLTGAIIKELGPNTDGGDVREVLNQLLS